MPFHAHRRARWRQGSEGAATSSRLPPAASTVHSPNILFFLPLLTNTTSSCCSWRQTPSSRRRGLPIRGFQLGNPGGALMPPLPLLLLVIFVVRTKKKRPGTSPTPCYEYLTVSVRAAAEVARKTVAPLLAPPPPSGRGYVVGPAANGSRGLAAGRPKPPPPGGGVCMRHGLARGRALETRGHVRGACPLILLDYLLRERRHQGAELPNTPRTRPGR